MMARIDAAVIAAHQWVVDRLQMEPDALVWWCVKIGAIIALVKCLLVIDAGIANWGDVLRLVLQPLNVLGLLFLSCLPRPGSLSLRLFSIFAAVLPFQLTPHGICSQMAAVNAACMLYFIACDKPKPPRRKVATRLGLT